jgi:hypothetical protein
MRFPYAGVLAPLLAAVACATGEDIVNKGKIATIDAGPQPQDETGGDPGDLGSGGAVGSGGTGSGAVTQGLGGGLGGSSIGGKASGGMPGSGGGKATGGASSGGAMSTGGSATGGKGGSGGGTGGAPEPGDGGSCQAGQKFCGGICTPPAPRVGCGTTGCDACTLVAPANGYVTCANNQCVFDCLSGFTKMGSTCMGTGTGQGGAGNCRPQSCMNCGVVLGPGCCTQAGKCGCPLIPYVAPTCL